MNCKVISKADLNEIRGFILEKIQRYEMGKSLLNKFLVRNSQKVLKDQDNILKKPTKKVIPKYFLIKHYLSSKTSTIWTKKKHPLSTSKYLAVSRNYALQYRVRVESFHTKISAEKFNFTPKFRLDLKKYQKKKLLSHPDLLTILVVARDVSSLLPNNLFIYLRILAAELNLNFRIILNLCLQSLHVVKSFDKVMQNKDSENKMVLTHYLNYFCKQCCKYCCLSHFYEGENEEIPRIQNKELKHFSFKCSASDAAILRIHENLTIQCIDKNYCSIYMKQVDVDCKLGAALLNENEIEYIAFLEKLNIKNSCFFAVVLGKYKCVEWSKILNEVKNSENYRKTEFSFNLGCENELEMNILNNKLKPKKQISFNSQIDYNTQCYHPGPCENVSCECTYCTEYCMCDSNKCSKQVKGCDCLPGKCNNKCTCWKQNRECDPKLCKSCGSNIKIKIVKKLNLMDEFIPCKNTSMRYNLHPRIIIGLSALCPRAGSIGVFAGQEFKKEDFITEYTGEIILDDEMDLRYKLTKSFENSYLFSIEPNYNIDSQFCGSKSRYLNHASKGFENAESKILFVDGRLRIGLFALKNIEIGSEILFNYGNEYTYNWKHEFDSLSEKILKELNSLKKKEKCKKQMLKFETTKFT